MALLVVGSVAYDSVQTPAGKVEEALGGSATYFSLSAGFFTEVRLVACVGEDFRPQDRFLLEKHGVDLEGLEVRPGRTFRWKGEYDWDLNTARTLDTQLNVFADFRPRIPERYRNSEFVFLGNIDPALQRQVLAQVNRPRLVACDTMNYWIEGHFPSLLETLRQVDLLIINDAETRRLANETSLIKAARRIMEWGPAGVVVKRGEYGALLFRRNPEGGLKIFGIPAYPLEEVVDPTGAGDTFAGGFMGYLAGSGRTDEAALRQAVVFGSVMASFNVEKFSVERLKDLTFTEVRLRYRDLQALTAFEGIED
jgi:sugar/nucleoside kinase (ribokinase family)